jgi:hypothetical protein
MVTYWGDEPPQAVECEFCEQIFYVKEIVTRTYRTGIGPEKSRFEE